MRQTPRWPLGEGPLALDSRLSSASGAASSSSSVRVEGGVAKRNSLGAEGSTRYEADASSGSNSTGATGSSAMLARTSSSTISVDSSVSGAATSWVASSVSTTSSYVAVSCDKDGSWASTELSPARISLHRQQSRACWRKRPARHKHEPGPRRQSRDSGRWTRRRADRHRSTQSASQSALRVSSKRHSIWAEPIPKVRASGLRLDRHTSKATRLAERMPRPGRELHSARSRPERAARRTG